MPTKAVRLTMPLVGAANPAGYLVLVPGASVRLRQGGVNLIGATDVGTKQVFSDNDKTPMNNPLPTGVAPGTAGVDTVGRLIVFLNPGRNYDAVVTVGNQSTTVALQDVGVDVDDVQAPIETGTYVPAADVDATVLPAPSGGDDTAALNAALAAGGRFRFRPGTYSIDSSVGITPPSNTEIQHHHDTILQATPALGGAGSAERRVYLIENKSNIKIFGGKLVGARATDTGTSSGFRVRGSTDVTIAFVKVVDFSLDAFYIAEHTAESQRVTVFACTADNNKRQGISVTGCIGFSIEANNFVNTNGGAPGAGIDIEPNAGFVCRNGRIIGNDCSNNTGNGIMVYAVAGAGTDITIAGNTSKSNGTQGIRLTRSSGIAVTGNTVNNNTGPGILLDNNNVGTETTDNVISGNVITANGGGGITLTGTSSDAIRRNIITGNAIVGNTGAGITCTHAGETVISGNTIRTNTSSGVSLTGTLCINNSITGNVVTGNQTGINASSDSSGSEIANNTVVENSNNGIRLNSSNENNVIGNRCVGNGTATNATYDNIILIASDNNTVQGNRCLQGTGANKSRYGINVSTSTCDTNAVWNNDLRTGGATGNINDAGTGTIIRTNFGYTSEVNLISPTFTIDSTGVKTVTIPHGLPFTPNREWAAIWISRNTNIATPDWQFAQLQVYDTNATNVICKVNVTVASATAGAVANIACRVIRL